MLKTTRVQSIGFSGIDPRGVELEITAHLPHFKNPFLRSPLSLSYPSTFTCLHPALFPPLFTAVGSWEHSQS